MNRKVTSEEIERLSQKLFDTPPTDECFEELKKEALRYLKSLNSPELDKKISWMEGLKNEGCNFMSIYQGFTPSEQDTIMNNLSSDTIEEILKRQVYINEHGLVSIARGKGGKLVQAVIYHLLTEMLQAEKQSNQNQEK